MRTRERAPARAGARGEFGGLGEFGRTAALAGVGLASGVLLIAVGAVVSLSWQVHPLLCPVALLALVWVAIRLARVVLSGRARRRS